MMRLEVVGIPVPQGSLTAYVVGGKKPGSKPHANVVDARQKKLKPWRQIIVDAATEYMRAHPLDCPMDGPLVLSVQFRFNRPASHYGTGRNADRLRPSAPEWPDAVRKGEGDLSKLVRAVEDALSDCKAIMDDSRFVRSYAEKVYVPRNRPPGATIDVCHVLDSGARGLT
jgi:crossover junction endodeoxyribonuclease RusA